MKQFSWTAIVSVTGLALCGLCRADTVFLKSGDEVEGTVVQENDLQVTVKLEGGATRTYRRSDVDSIIKTPRAAGAEPMAEAPKPVERAESTPKAQIPEQKAVAPAFPVPAPPSADDKADTKYAVEGKGFTIKYPQKWRKAAEGAGGVRFASLDGSAVVSVELTDMPQNFDFQTFFRMEVMSDKKLTDYSELDNCSISIAGHNAKKYAYSYKQGGGSASVVSYWLFKGRQPSGYTIYKINCVCKSDAFDKLKGLFDDMATSFDFE